MGSCCCRLSSLTMDKLKIGIACVCVGRIGVFWVGCNRFSVYHHALLLPVVDGCLASIIDAVMLMWNGSGLTAVSVV